jgi:hypothetical protein
VSIPRSNTELAHNAHYVPTTAANGLTVLAEKTA